MTDLPEALKHNALLSTWLWFDDDSIIVRTGKVEIGQGIKTAIAMIAAEELDVEPARIIVSTGRTDQGPNEFITAGSMSVEGSGAAVRHVCAQARAELVARAAEAFNVVPDTLQIDNGVISNPDGNEQISYWALLDSEQLDIEASPNVTLKSPQNYSLVGRTLQRLDLPAKLRGNPAFVQDLRFENLHHARIIRPADINATLLEFDSEDLDSTVKLVQDGNFLAVVAPSETLVSRAQNHLLKRVRWQSEGAAPEANIESWLRDGATHHLLVQDGTPTDQPIPDRRQVQFEATYFKPYHLHGAIGPSSAVAVNQGGHITVHSHTQGPALARISIAKTLGIDPKQVTVIHAENAGCYGHNGADDAAMDAALIAYHLPGIPILLKWQRADEHQHEPRSPAMVIDVGADATDGHIDYWQADIYSQTHMGRPIPRRDDAVNLLAAWQKSEPLARPIPEPGMAPHGGIHRNADPYYDFDDKRITKNLNPGIQIRTSSTRALGAFANVFAIESFMDEFAHFLQTDPTQFRLNHLNDPRARALINVASDELRQIEIETDKHLRPGRGIAFARYKNTKCYAAVGVLLTVDENTFETRMRHAVIAADAGQIIDRDGLANQLEGGLIQAASWALKEQVDIQRDISDWDDYPILRFPEIPTIDIHLLDHPDQPSLGAGEATAGPTPAAIANAIFDATGLRIRRIPFLPDALRQLALTS